MENLRKTYSGPVFSFEVGQFEVLPDFDELEDFKGITDPANLRWIRERVEKQGLMPVWKDMWRQRANYPESAIGRRSRLPCAPESSREFPCWVSRIFPVRVRLLWAC